MGLGNMKSLAKNISYFPQKNSRLKQKILQWLETWKGRDYHEGIPDEAPDSLESLNKAPSYRMICKAILKNDRNLETLGFTRQPCEAYNAIKKIEIAQRKKKSMNVLEATNERFIGLYRQGATWEQICAVMNYDIATIKIVIAKYLKAIAIAL